jgi:hypothetical protein
MVGLVIAFAGLFSMMGLCAKDLILDEPGCDITDSAKGLCEIKTFDVVQVFGHMGFVMYIFAGNPCVINLRAES